MYSATLLMVILAVSLLGISFFKDQEEAKEGLLKSYTLFLNMIPLIITAFLVAGLLETVMPADLVSKYMGENSGITGLLIGSLAGIIIPGGPYVAFPIIYSVYQAGAGLPTVISFLVGWSLWNVGKWPFEIALLGPSFTMMRMASTLIFPPLAGIIASFLIQFF
ncbi:MAG: permease [Halanaerobium sp.]|nr:permease [Halanaerobium sp.]